MPNFESAKDFESLLDYLKRNRGFDFTGYKRTSLARRIDKRMLATNVQGYGEYVDYLEVHPDEFAALFNTILINVTSFFRDDTTWWYLGDHVLPDLLAHKGPAGHIRVWSAGCATGEEAYSLAMLLAEKMGIEQFRSHVKIYATDVDEEALSKGRHATYTDREVQDIPEALLKKYFETTNGSYVFRKDLRRQVIFGRHDLINDAPISRVDLLVCRNTLMYLNAETQAKILARFHFALNDGGILFLGRAETLLTHASTFIPIDVKRRISSKVPRGNLDLRDRLILLAQGGGAIDDPTTFTTDVRLREMALDSLPIAQVVVDTGGFITLANDRARVLFSIAGGDIGKPLQDLKVSYKPIDLRSLIDQAQMERRAVAVRDVEWQITPGDARWIDIQLTPLFDDGTYLGTSISFIDVSAPRRLQRELEHARQQLETAYEELQSTNEELETTNEELQSTVEELETTNEELQSTNEELETMNEELQATNEELTTINEEVRLRGEELNEVNRFLDSVLKSIRGAVVVVDRDLSVLVWSPRALELWGLREEEAAGKNFLQLDFGLPVTSLRQPLKACLSEAQESTEVELPAVNRRGREIVCRVGISRLIGAEGKLKGAILVMEPLEEQVRLVSKTAERKPA